MFGYDAAMPVELAHAYALLHAFGMLEFTLKRTRGFVTADGKQQPGKRVRAKADWVAVDKAVRALPSHMFLERVSQDTKDRMLGGERVRPQVQYFHVDDAGNSSADYEDTRLPDDDAEALVVAMRRVRNNLFHGGKEDPLDDPLDEDKDWVKAATEVAGRLLELLERGQLRPVAIR